MPYKLGELAAKIGGEVAGDPDILIKNVASLKHATPDQISFLANSGYVRRLAETRAGAVILSERYRHECRVNMLVVDNPYAAYARVAQILNPAPAVAAGIHPTAVIHPSSVISATAEVAATAVIGAEARIGDGASIGPGCVIESGVVIGAGSRLIANVTVRKDCVIGDSALIHPGVVIGSDGFGFANDRNIWIKIPQLGRVLIGDNVEIGSNTTIDRGAIDDTVIGDGVKLDNQIQVAHNVHIGEHTAIAAGTAIAGSTTIGKRCAIGGCVGIVGHLEIADDVQISGMTFVTQSIGAAGAYASGSPMEPVQSWRRNFVRIKQLDEMARRIKELERIVAELNNRKG